MQFKLKNKAILTNMCPESLKAIQQQLTISNPAYAKAGRLKKLTGRVPKNLKFYNATPAVFECPKGAARMLLGQCWNKNGAVIKIDDFSRILNPVPFDFKSTLNPFQAQAVKRCLKNSIGMLVAPSGIATRDVALKLISLRKQRALIVVHTKKLLNQWIDRIGTSLEIKATDVGIIGDGKFRIGDIITVAMVQTLHKRAAEVAPHIGHLIFDECHDAPVMQSVEIIEQFECKYLLGLTATPYRRDGLGKLMQWHLGPVTGWADKKDMPANSNQCQAVCIPTGFKTIQNPSSQYPRVFSEMTQDLARNQLICSTVKSLNGTGITLVLSDRRKHCESLADILKQKHGIQAAVLTGQTSAKEREQIIQDLRSGRCQHLVATGQLIGEGFDLPEIGTLALATPVRLSSRFMQYIKLALRPAHGKVKTPVILDFVDDHGVFESAARSRWETYVQQGIEVTGKF